MTSGRGSEKRSYRNSNMDGDDEDIIQKWILKMEEAEKAEDATLTFFSQASTVLHGTLQVNVARSVY